MRAPKARAKSEVLPTVYLFFFQKVQNRDFFSKLEKMLVARPATDSEMLVDRLKSKSHMRPCDRKGKALLYNFRSLLVII